MKAASSEAEKDDPFCDVGDRLHAADRQPVDHLRSRRRDVVGAEIARSGGEHLVAHIGVDRAGMHRVDPDAVALAGEFERRGLVNSVTPPLVIE